MPEILKIGDIGIIFLKIPTVKLQVAVLLSDGLEKPATLDLNFLGL